MSERHKDVEKMISTVMEYKDLSRAAAIDYMLTVATGRLNALWRYTETLDGKPNKGILQLAGRKKRAEKTPRIGSEQEKKPAKSKPAKSKPAKSKPAKSKPAKSKPAKAKKSNPESEEISTAATE